MEGPAFPRWIASSKCDSQAMISAFLDYKQQCTTAEAEALAVLYMVEHAEQDFLIIFYVLLRRETLCVVNPYPYNL